MFIQKVREVVKSKIPRRGLSFKIIQSAYYQLKKVLDFLFFKFQHPAVKWFYIFKEKNLDKSFSQFGQDRFLLKLLGQGKRYVEVGANHPVRLNNTFLLEKHNWTGVSIDPLGKYVKDWEQLRQQPFINVAIGDDNTTLRFVEFNGDELWYDMMSGFKEHVRPEDLITFSSIEYKVQVRRLDEVVPFDAFDVLLVDVEGAEMQVLHGIDLSRYRPTYILLENAGSIGGDHKIRQYMSEKDYKLVARIGCTDDVFELR